MDYIADTSALVDAWSKWYSPRSNLSFWQKIEELGRDGVLGIPDAVVLEIEEIEDDLRRWCKDRESFLTIPTTREIQTIVSTIAVDYPNLRNSPRPGKNFADPVVIAAAEYYGSAVVTHESYTGNIHGPRIPDVCRDKRIRVIQMHHLVDDLGWTFQ